MCVSFAQCAYVCGQAGVRLTNAFSNYRSVSYTQLWIALWTTRSSWDHGAMELSDPLDPQDVSPQNLTQDAIDEFRRLSAEQAAGVAVISTVHQGRDYAATVSSYLSVSYDPPTLLVSLYEGSRITEAVTRSGRWALTILDARQRKEADWLASPGTPIEGLLQQLDFRRGPATGAAVVSGSLAYFELVTEKVVEAATHLLVVGQVINMGDSGVYSPAAAPLIHYGGEYRQLK